MQPPESKCLEGRFTIRIHSNEVNHFTPRKTRELQSGGRARARARTPYRPFTIGWRILQWPAGAAITSLRGYYWRRTCATASHCRVSPVGIPPCLTTPRSRSGGCVTTEHRCRIAAGLIPSGENSAPRWIFSGFPEFSSERIKPPTGDLTYIRHFENRLPFWVTAWPGMKLNPTGLQGGRNVIAGVGEEFDRVQLAYDISLQDAR